MKFETINNRLCRMVEPEPLTPEANFPCVVRLIQDDSPMGRYNLKLRNIALEPLVVTGIAKDIGVVTHLVPRPHFSCECYEIIGYPVEEGSAEWALYSAMNGKSFVHKDDKQCRIFTMFSEMELRVSDGEGEIVEYVEIDRFLNDAAKDGWQLYEEPQPEPAFKVGDWVEIDGKQYRLSGVPLCGCAYPHNQKWYVLDINGNEFTHYASENIHKLSPSEVIVKIGCLSGTVEKAQDYAYFLLWHSKTDCDYSMIKWSAIDTPTREMVERLLKAQEGE